MSTATTQIETEKQLIPELRFKEFDGEWNEITLRQLFTFKNGLNSDKEKYGSGIKFINVMDIIGNETITYDSIIGKVEVTDKELEKNEVIYGDVLFQRSSETREEVGQANIYVDKFKSAVFGGFVIRGRKKQDYDPYFINYLLKTSPARKEITTKSGGSTRYNVGQESLSQVFVNLTTLPEQQKIASFLSAVDEKIQQLTKKKALLKQYKKGVMQQLFSRQLRFKDENGNPFPAWEDEKLKDVLLEHKTKNKDGVVTEVFSVAKKKGVINQIEHLGRSYAAKTTLHYKVTFPGDLIYTKSPTKDFPFGIIKQNLTGRKGLVSPLYVVATPQTESLGFMFHCYFLSWVNVYNYLVPLVQKGAKNTMNINNDDFLNGAKFMLPVSKNEQQKIADYLSSIDTKIESVNNQITQVQTFKKGLLQQMFV